MTLVYGRSCQGPSRTIGLNRDFRRRSTIQLPSRPKEDQQRKNEESLKLMKEKLASALTVMKDQQKQQMELKKEAKKWRQEALERENLVIKYQQQVKDAYKRMKFELERARDRRIHQKEKYEEKIKSMKIMMGELKQQNRILLKSLENRIMDSQNNSNLQDSSLPQNEIPKPIPATNPIMPNPKSSLTIHPLTSKQQSPVQIPSKHPSTTTHKAYSTARSKPITNSSPQPPKQSRLSTQPQPIHASPKPIPTKSPSLKPSYSNQSGKKQFKHVQPQSFNSSAPLFRQPRTYNPLYNPIIYPPGSTKRIIDSDSMDEDDILSSGSDSIHDSQDSFFIEKSSEISKEGTKVVSNVIDFIDDLFVEEDQNESLILKSPPPIHKI
jgi:hypothetical protein